MAARVLSVFLRAPIAGQVKSRLAGALGAERARTLYEAFLTDTLAAAANAAQRSGAALELAAAGPIDHPFVRAVAVEHGAAIVAQPEGDLGVRIGDAIDRHVARGTAVCLIGSDSPQLTGAQIARGFDGLVGHEVAIGPSRDGGYWLIGARAPIPELLVEMPWSTPSLLPMTLERLAAGGRSVALLEMAFDVDEAADLEFLRRWLAVVPPGIAGATRRVLAGG
jgi:rSAM/selenodomain-associated transferase 1